MEETQVYLGKKLKAARTESGLKQDQVAQYMQLSTSAISGMEKGNRKIDAWELQSLSKLYGKPLEWFFSDHQPLPSQNGVRWYDHDPVVREAIFLLQKAPVELRHKAAYGLLGFLSDR